MYQLPAQNSEWLAQFQNKVRRERLILGTLIQWGFESVAFEVHRDIEGYLKKVRSSHVHSIVSSTFDPVDVLKKEIRQILRRHYLDGLGLPLGQRSQPFLQGAYLNGFEEQAAKLVRLYRHDIQQQPSASTDERAA